MKNFSLLLFAAMLLMACEGENSRTTIDPNDGNPEKPTVILSNRVMLTLAGLSELHELLNLTLNEKALEGCAQRHDNNIEWNCHSDQNQPSRRKGIVQLKKEAQSLNLSTEDMMIAWVAAGGRLIRSLQDLTLKLNNGRLDFSTTYIYQLAQGGSPVQRQLTWQISGLISGQAPDFNLADADVLLTIYRKKGRSESNTTYHLTASEPLQLNGCGQTMGNFLFSGFEQEELPVLADNQNVRSSKTKNKHLWPTCAANLYNLKMAAPYWTQPTP